ncbi:signal peptidase I [Lachnospiraceae bacterium DSM 108991]|jgi:signal peptidase I|uniref:Signal peptidase I n=1 Tax=Claveliimonas monacensis TaxID=2779351 RepID=A0ABR9RFW5_9FIRM|nr:MULTISPECIES: signal peptidase I [Lachnospiraceae]MBE5061812.1 signal peptidase I [Claveliimonas monacensis]
MRGLKFRRRRRRRRNTFRIEMLKPVAVWAGKIAVVCLFAFVFVWYFGQRVAVVGDSMSPILSNGDVTLVNRIVYDATAPKRGDIIVFKPKGNENSHYYIKRIIGLPGETVQILEGEIYIDGEKLEEDYGISEITDPGIAAEEIELAGDEFFVLGDDRENSEDSRMADVGAVKRSYIYGKVWFIVSPWEDFGLVRS